LEEEKTAEHIGTTYGYNASKVSHMKRRLAMRHM